MGDGQAGAGVDDVGIGLAIGFEVIAIGAGGHDGDPFGLLQFEDALDLAAHGRGLFHRHPPGGAVGLAALDLHLAADLGQIVVDAMAFQNLGHAGDGVTLGDGVQAEFDQGVPLAQRVGGGVDLQLVQADMGQGGLDLRRGRYSLLVPGETPELGQGLHRGVVTAAGQVMNPPRQIGEQHQVGGDRLGLGGLALVEAAQFRVLPPGGKMLVDVAKQGLDLGLDLVRFDRDPVEDHLQVPGGALSVPAEDGLDGLLAAGGEPDQGQEEEGQEAVEGLHHWCWIHFKSWGYLGLGRCLD